jgi:hypothetical protein
MSKLNSEQEELENFLADYITQVRMMSELTDVEIKVVMRRVMQESPEWFEMMVERYRKKVLTKMMKGMAKDVKTDFAGEVRKVA